MTYTKIYQKDIGFYLCILTLESNDNRHNCFEQFWINYVNERIQQLFVENMLKKEEDWFHKDGLEVPNIPFFDNIRIISE